jgi:hypothetical protein
LADGANRAARELHVILGRAGKSPDVGLNPQVEPSPTNLRRNGNDELRAFPNLEGLGINDNGHNVRLFDCTVARKPGRGLVKKRVHREDLRASIQTADVHECSACHPRRRAQLLDVRAVSCEMRQLVERRWVAVPLHVKDRRVGAISHRTPVVSVYPAAHLSS